MKKILYIIFLNLIFCNQSISVELKNLKYLPDVLDNLQVCKAYYKILKENGSSQKSEVKMKAYVSELNKYKDFNFTDKLLQDNAKKLNKYFSTLIDGGADKIILDKRYKKTCDKLIGSSGISMPWDALEAVANEKQLFKQARLIIDPFDGFTITYKFERKDGYTLSFEGIETAEVKANKPKEVKGKKLFCLWNNDPISGFGIEFNNKNKVRIRAIDEDNEKLFTINGKYKALSDKIIIEYKNLNNDDDDIIINRKTLKINNASRSSCTTINKSRSIETKLKLALDKLISEKSSENKF